MKETLGTRVRMHRARLDLSQTALGEKVGLSTNTISAIEAGKHEPRVSHLKALAKVLGVKASYLLGEDEDSELIPAAVA
jgi:transcriptional regulator with XRE-family HTH domain